MPTKMTDTQAHYLNCAVEEVTIRIPRQTRDALERRGWITVLPDGACRITPAGVHALETAE